MGLFGKKKEEPKQTEEQEEEDEENTYETTVTCNNCEEETTFEVPCRTKVNDFIKGKRCEYCECVIKEDEK